MADTEARARLAVLSQPKLLSPYCLPDRRSVYWVDRVPLQPGPNGTTEICVTARQDQLSKHKTLQPSWWDIHRERPVYPVSDGAKTAEVSARVAALAESKQLNADYEFSRPVQSQVSRAARSTEPSSRVQTLSQQKPHLIWPSYDTVQDKPFNEPITTVSAPARQTRPTGRLEQLAEHRRPVAMYKFERPVRWDVSDNAKNATATNRLQQLARPKSARLMKDDFDPYRVSVGAKNSAATARVCELSAPIPRKVRSKIIV